MKKKIAEIAIALGILGIIGSADVLETSTATFLLSEAISFAIATAGVIIWNKKAEAEAPAHTMKNCTKQNS